MEEKYCDRCKAQISCNKVDIQNCACFKLEINEDTLAFLNKTSYDCLCNACLTHVQELVELGKQVNTNEALEENLHFYKEGNLMVFTEFYHMQRGYCCKSSCRHCAYAYKKTAS